MFQCDDTRDCIIQFCTPDDEHMCSKHVEAWNKLITKFSASSWLILINKYIEMHVQQNIKIVLVASSWSSTMFIQMMHGQTHIKYNKILMIIFQHSWIIYFHIFQNYYKKIFWKTWISRFFRKFVFLPEIMDLKKKYKNHKIFLLLFSAHCAQKSLALTQFLTVQNSRYLITELKSCQRIEKQSHLQEKNSK